MDTHHTRQQTVLAVDDMRTNLISLANLLKDEWHVKIAMDGENALRIASRPPHPDLIMLDVKMPEMDGYEVCRRLKENPETRKIPIIFITALNEEKDESRGLEMGAIDYISKPFSPALIKARVRNHLQVQKMSNEYECVFNGSQDAMFLVGFTGKNEFRYIRNNRTHQQSTGLSLETIQGATPEEVFGNPRGKQTQAKYDQCVQAGESVSYEETVPLPAGEKTWHTRLTPVSEGGKISYIVGSSTDITERKKAEESVAVANKKEKEFESRIEQMLLQVSPPPAIRGASLGTLSIPSRHLDGDFIDFHSFDSQCFDLVIGDVMGKGIQAALIGAGTKNLFLQALSRLGYKQAGESLQQNKPMEPPKLTRLVSLVEAELGKRLISLERFITLCYARIDLSQKQLSFIDCGHTEIMLKRGSTGKVEALKGHNMPLGFTSEQEFDSTTIELMPDDLLLFYSDGVTEAANADGEMFGTERLADFLRELPNQKETAEIPRQLQNTVSGFTGKKGFSDDFTCTAIRIDPPYIFHRQLEIDGTLDSLPALRELNQNLLAAPVPLYWPENHACLFEVAVQEAFVNIIEHGFQGCQHPVVAEVTAAERWLKVRLEYPGKAFDFSSVPPLDTERQTEEKLDERGRGLHIIRSVMDECRSEQADFDRACVTLIKKCSYHD